VEKIELLNFKKIFSTSMTNSKYILHVESTSFLSKLNLIYGKYMIIP